MTIFHLFSFIPVLVFSLLIWYERIIRQGHNKRNNTLFISGIIVALSGIFQMSFYAFRPIWTEFSYFQFYAISHLFYCLAFLLLEYSIHSNRIDESFLYDDFKDNLKALKLPLILMGLSLAWALFVTPRGTNPNYLKTLFELITPDYVLKSPQRAYTNYLHLGATGFFAGLYWVLFVCIFKLFNLLEGVIRQRKYPFISNMIVAAVYMFLFFFTEGYYKGVPFWPFFFLNVVYFLRILEEYYFWNSYHIRAELSRQTERAHTTNLLLKKVITSPESEDKHIILNTVKNFLEKAQTRLVVSEYKFSGAAIYMLSGNSLKVSSAEHIIGFCPPLKESSSIKSLARDKIEGFLLGLTFDLQKISETPIDKLKVWGDILIKKLLSRETDVVIETDIITSYRGMLRLVCLVPIWDMDRLVGMIVLYKDSFDRVYPGEKEILLDLAESLSVTYSIIAGKNVQKERNRLQGEMDTAKNIQTSMLPKSIDLEGYESAAIMETATEVGGDVYDFIPTPFGNYFGIGDVAGHGLPSGLMALIQMSAFHGAVESSKEFEKELPIDKIYDVVNRVLCTINKDRIGSDKFMTQNYLIEKDGTFTHSGTHEIALLYRAATGTTEELNGLADKTGFLGISEYVVAGQSVGSFTMNKNDILVLYTDGVIEAKNNYSTQYGIERVKEVLQKNPNSSPEEIIQIIKDNLTEHARSGDFKHHNGQFADDVSMVVLKRK